MNLSAENIGQIRELVRSGYPLKARDAKDLLGHNDHLVELLEARGRLMLGVEIERDQLKAENEALLEEVALDDKLIADRDRLLNMFECPVHGQCIPYAMGQVEALRKDASRWRAFITCAHIKFFGWVGYGEKDPYGNSPGNYRHFGGEFWTIHDAPTADKEKAAEILNGFADAAVAAMGKGEQS
ncbi:hypothetical protein [Pseudomonas sp. FP2254]|uniref:hypothetical protein n=1 Tax=Pseudomonas sp. FP2254 TaxID=2954087 RepID=UPI0027364E61|nr:hypothetical protein [Pseudomonas sp. FP2254]WLH42095.1 hypothetical protein PSH94_05900 [Pseudomonas sp. FP2254]